MVFSVSLWYNRYEKSRFLRRNSKMKQLNSENFNTFLQETEGLVLIDFWAQWCGPCRMIAPVLEEIDSELDTVSVAKVDVDANPDLADRFGIEAIPTLIFFRNGQMVQKKTGLYPKDGLMLIIRDLLQ